MKLLPLAAANCAAFGFLIEWTEAAAVLRASRLAEARFEEPESEEELIEQLEKEAQQEEDDASLQAKNLESEMAYRESLQSQEQRDENAAAALIGQEVAAPGCAVEKSGSLDVATDPTDVLTTVPMNISISRRHMNISYPGPSTAPAMRIPLVELKTPVETLARSRRCFRLFHTTKPLVFCADDTAARDDWVSAVYKAVFCINSGAPLTPPEKKAGEMATEKGESLSLPSRSTKVQRWIKEIAEQEKAALREVQEGETLSRKKKNVVEEIEIVGGPAGTIPKVTVNGDELAFPHAVQGEPRMNESNMEF